MSITKLSTFVLIAVFAASVAQAALTYVDAVDGATGNTYATGGSLADTSWTVTGTSANSDPTWRKRSTFGNGGVIYEGGYAADDPELTTEITGLSDGDYDVWVFFWDASGSNTWNIATGLTSGSLTTYSFDGLGDTSSPVAASTLSFTAAQLVTESDRILYGVNLGLTPVAGGTLNIYIDNGAAATDDRTWYDGVAYEFIPEPSTLVLSSLILTSLCLRRRRR